MNNLKWNAVLKRTNNMKIDFQQTSKAITLETFCGVCLRSEMQLNFVKQIEIFKLKCHCQGHDWIFAF